MKKLLSGLLMVTILVFVNIVGAGVAMVMGTWFNRHDVETDPLLWIIIMAAATWCAICFMQGAMKQAHYLTKRTGT